MDTKEFLKKYEEFHNYLQSVDIDAWKSSLTLDQLKSLDEELASMRLPDISSEISKALKEMKDSEFPQSKEVYRFPELNDIQFLSEKKKIELDKYLGMLKPGGFVFHLARYAKEPKRLESFLREKGIVGGVYHLTCPSHTHLKISPKMTHEEINRVKMAIIEKDADYLQEAVGGYFCPTCEDVPDYREWHDEYVTEVIVLTKEREWIPNLRR